MPCSALSAFVPSLSLLGCSRPAAFSRDSLGGWQLFYLLFLLEINSSFVVTNPRQVHCPMPWSLTTFPWIGIIVKPSFPSWDPNTSPNIMKEYKRHLQCEVGVSCNLMRETERDSPLMGHPTCDRALDSNLVEHGGQKVGYQVFLPRGTHCLGLAQSIAARSLTSLFPCGIIKTWTLSLGIYHKALCFPLVMVPSSRWRLFFLIFLKLT